MNGAGAPLTGMRDLTVAVQTVTTGRNTMPSFSASLTAEQIRDVSTYLAPPPRGQLFAVSADDGETLAAMRTLAGICDLPLVERNERARGDSARHLVRIDPWCLLNLTAASFQRNWCPRTSRRGRVWPTL